MFNFYMNKKAEFSFKFFILFLVVLIFACFFAYLVFFSGNDGSASGFESFLKSVGFDSPDEDAGAPAVSLPSSYGGVGGASGGSSGTSGVGGAGGSSSSPSSLAFCNFDNNHIVSGLVPCRCGFGAVCDTIGQSCDATFNNGQGVCT